jgi:hypothetical protein
MLPLAELPEEATAVSAFVRWAAVEVASVALSELGLGTKAVDARRASTTSLAYGLYMCLSTLRISAEKPQTARGAAKNQGQTAAGAALRRRFAKFTLFAAVRETEAFTRRGCFAVTASLATSAAASNSMPKTSANWSLAIVFLPAACGAALGRVAWQISSR